MDTSLTELRDLPAHIQKIRDGLEDLFKNLPRNKQAEYIGVSSFVMKMSQLSGGKLDPGFYEYERQHEALNKLIQEYPIEGLNKKLEEVCLTGKIIRYPETLCLHPEVVGFIRAALEGSNI